MLHPPRSLATIDLAALRHNVRLLKGRLEPGVGFLAVVKADGYGHGALRCAVTAIEAGATGVAVATAEEAVALRETGFGETILVMGPLYGVDEYREMAGRGVECTVVTEEMAKLVPRLARRGLNLRLHVKVDSGMNRAGLLPWELAAFLESASGVDCLDIVGIMTHFAAAPEDPGSVDAQLSRFLPCVEMVKAEWPQAVAHAANSAATMHFPQAHLDLVRCGIAVYGLSPGQGDAELEGLRPALSWTTQVALVKRVPAGEGVGYGYTYRPSADTDVALVPVGYGDGVFRLLGNRGEVIIRGRRYPMVGRVSMDSFGVDVGTDCHVAAGDTVTLIGHDGEARVTAEEMANWAETINYEITCSVSVSRTRRVFTG